MSKKQGETSFPIILFFLHNNRWAELIRLLLNRKTAEKELRAYGEAVEQKEEREEIVMQSDLLNFTVHDVWQMKCESKNNYFCNLYLQEFVLRKLRAGSSLTAEERKRVWVQFTQMKQLNGLYAGLKELQLSTETESIIDKDIKRTYSCQAGYGTSSKEEHLCDFRSNCQQVLQQFAKYNPLIGYCQGMNTVVAFFSDLQLSNQTIFFLLKRITECLLPCDYYSSMDSTITYIRIVFEMLHHTHPRIYARMKEIIASIDGGDAFMLTMSAVFQWFVCLFTNSGLQKSIRLLVLDYFLVEGVPALFKAALALFDHLQDKILSVHEFDQYIQTVETETLRFCDENLLRQRLNNYLNPTLLRILAEKLISVKEEKESRRQTPRQATKCNSNWNYCLQQTDPHLQCGYKHEYFVFRTNEPLRVVPDYLDKVKTNYFLNYFNKSKRKVDHFRIARIQHSCRPMSQTDTETSHHEDNNTSKISNCSFDSDTPSKLAQIEDPEQRQELRRRMKLNLERKWGLKHKIKRSESMAFLFNMYENESFTNLLQHLQEDELDIVLQGSSASGQQLSEFDTDCAFKKCKNKEQEQNAVDVNVWQ